MTKSFRILTITATALALSSPAWGDGETTTIYKLPSARISAEQSAELTQTVTTNGSTESTLTIESNAQANGTDGGFVSPDLALADFGGNLGDY